MCIHHEPDRSGKQDQCVINKRDDRGRYSKRFRSPGRAIPRRICVHRRDSLRHCKRRSKDCEPHKAEEPNDIFIPAEYSAHAKEEEEGCGGVAYGIHPSDRSLEHLAVCGWGS